MNANCISRHSAAHWAMACLLLITAAVIHADTIESTSGAKIEGKIKSRTASEVAIEVSVGANTLVRHISIKYIRAITIDGKREEISAAAPATAPAASKSASGTGASALRTRAEVESIIQKQGKTPPEWLEATTLNYPPTLDLSYAPPKKGDPWNNQKNVGAYYWDVINPNPGRWHEGLKLAYHLLELHDKEPEVRGRVALEIGIMYHHLFLDYARAAYWFRQAEKTNLDAANLAECYWKLGNKAMALDLLKGSNYVTFSTIKLYADLGDTDRAVQLAQAFGDGAGAAEADVLAGDACRLAGRTAQAMKLYERAAALPDSPRNARAKKRAKAALEAIKFFDLLDLKKIADGVYTASSMGYETDVEVEVKVTAGRIEDIRITKHHEKQYYASITETPARIIAKQSVKGIDATSRATITSEAIINATAKALNSGMK